jgi:pyruvate/2-oxoglutarate dehydrogenase complex dihydrolipoamide acyltransferase (E2) component
MSVSIREFARQRGVSDTAVRKAIDRGEIAQEPDGSIDAAKNAAWQPRAQARRAATAHPPPPPQEPASAIPDYSKSRAIREAYAARLAKLEFEERAGKLVSADEARIEQFRIARALRDRLLQLPAKIAPQLVALIADDPDVAAAQTMLETELRELLSEFVQDL